MFKIEKNVPRPHYNAHGKYPFKDMEVGDSFLINDNTKYQAVGNAASVFGKIHKRKFSIRKTPEGHRCWRVA